MKKTKKARRKFKKIDGESIAIRFNKALDKLAIRANPGIYGFLSDRGVDEQICEDAQEFISSCSYDFWQSFQSGTLEEIEKTISEIEYMLERTRAPLLKLYHSIETGSMRKGPRKLG